MTLTEFATACGVSTRTIRNRIKAGVLKVFRIGGIGNIRLTVDQLPAMVRVDDRETMGQRRKRAEKAWPLRD